MIQQSAMKQNKQKKTKKTRYKREQGADRKCPRLRVLGTTLQPQGKEPGQRDTTKNHAKHRDIFKSNLAICLKRHAKS